MEAHTIKEKRKKLEKMKQEAHGDEEEAIEEKNGENCKSRNRQDEKRATRQTDGRRSSLFSEKRGKTCEKKEGEKRNQ